MSLVPFLSPPGSSFSSALSLPHLIFKPPTNTTTKTQVPQLVENYRQKSAQGISLSFLCVWFIGDVANLIGALWARLVPTVIALAIYFCVADTILIAQCVYYNTLNAREELRLRQENDASAMLNEEEPLLSRRESELSTTSNIGLPGSRRRKSSGAASRRTLGPDGQHLPKISEDPLDLSGGAGKEWAKNMFAIFLICAVGAAGWAVSWQVGVWVPVPEGSVVGDDRPTPIGAEIVGYFSALCYLGARIPQIVKNARERSCDGLSLLFFLLSVVGNLTYGAGVSSLLSRPMAGYTKLTQDFKILFHSLEKKYIITNLPWLIGSLGTMVEDAIIFIQFHVYGDKEATEAIE